MTTVTIDFELLSNLVGVSEIGLGLYETIADHMCSLMCGENKDEEFHSRSVSYREIIDEAKELLR